MEAIAAPHEWGHGKIVMACEVTRSPRLGDISETDFHCLL
jgi:hypothetical protein